MKSRSLRTSLTASIAVASVLAGCSHHRKTAAAVPAAASAQKTVRLASPHSWPVYGLNNAHDAAFSGGSVAGGVRWVFRVPGAIPSHMGKKAVEKTYVSVTAVRDLVGIPVGVSVVDGVVYVPDDNGFVYAVNAETGHLKWQFNARNQIMTTPIVVGRGTGRLVFVGGGNSTFSYTQAIKFGHKGAPVIRGTDIAGIYALHATTGKLAWVYHTKGEDMPTPAYVKGTLVFGNGDGHIYGLNAKTGHFLWKVGIKSFVSMSSATRYHNLVIMAGTHPNAIYAVNAHTGKLAWRTAPSQVFSSSMGDCAPAQSGGTVITQYEQRASGKHQARSVEMALNAKTGHILWQTVLGQGPVPPRNKDGVPMIANGVVYTGSPVTATAYALSLKTGHVLWHTPLKVKMKAAPSVSGKYVFYPVGNGTIFVLNRQTGKEINAFPTRHGGFGPQNAVIVDKTLMIGSNFGWMYAWPIAALTAPTP
ncbi:MAG: outer membrane protein assembly factor BamB family protein [Acidiferrobacter sp.]